MLQIHTAVHDKMIFHATETYPEECCGVMLGQESGGTRTVRHILDIRNTKEENRNRRYLITPDYYKHAEEYAAQHGVLVLGMYHSHPDHPAEPSQFDLDHALPWWSYVILSVGNGVHTATRSWLLRDDRSSFDEEQLVLLQEEVSHVDKEE